MDRPISIISYDASDFKDIKNNRYSTLINGNSEEGEPAKGKLLQNMSSGLGTTDDSKDEEKTESLEMKNMQTTASQDTEHDAESTLDGKKDKKEKQNSQDTDECKQPWLTLASYVDELTVGGRRNSKGHFIDGITNFPGFGRNKPDKLPPDCFPAHCYQR